LPTGGSAQAAGDATMRQPRPQESVKLLDPFFILYWGFVSSVVLVIACFARRSAEQAKVDEEDVENSSFAGSQPRATELPQNLWTLNLAAAVGQVKIGRHELRPAVVNMLSVFFGTLQILALFLVAHDINPSAPPVTEHPASPWIQSPWSVNCMKWIMVTFLSLFMVNESAQCRILFVGIACH